MGLGCCNGESESVLARKKRHVHGVRKERHTSDHSAIRTTGASFPHAHPLHDSCWRDRWQWVGGGRGRKEGENGEDYAYILNLFPPEKQLHTIHQPRSQLPCHATKKHPHPQRTRGNGKVEAVMGVLKCGIVVALGERERSTCALVLCGRSANIRQLNIDILTRCVRSQNQAASQACVITRQVVHMDENLWSTMCFPFENQLKWCFSLLLLLFTRCGN